MKFPFIKGYIWKTYRDYLFQHVTHTGNPDFTPTLITDIFRES